VDGAGWFVGGARGGAVFVLVREGVGAFVAIVVVIIFIMIGGGAVVVAGSTWAPGWEWPPGCWPFW
jgi:hypothetical protein